MTPPLGSAKLPSKWRWEQHLAVPTEAANYYCSSCSNAHFIITPDLAAVVQAFFWLSFAGAGDDGWNGVYRTRMVGFAA